MSEARELSPEDCGRARFGRVLSDALGRRHLTQQEFARVVGASQSSVSGWMSGRHEPPSATVLAMERMLGLEPGDLCRPLGYLPVDPDQVPSVEGAIAECAALDDEAKAALLQVHRLLLRSVDGFRPTDASAGSPGASRTPE
jgi:transcriptional regulator with XRE-family HTH domain